MLAARARSARSEYRDRLRARIVLAAAAGATSGAVQEVRPGSSAAMTEYGQPGIICAWPFPRPYT